MPWTVVVNPVAGRGRARKLLPRLEDACASPALRALDLALTVSEAPEDAGRLAREAAERGRGLVACGGDGLVAELAGVAAEADVPLAIVPGGAGNDFARALGIPHRRPLVGLGALLTGTERRVDLGRAAGRWFTSVANTGFDAEANRWANGVDAVSGTTLYVAAVLRTLATYRPRPLRITADEASVEVDAYLVAIANGRSYAGGMQIAPQASLDDGMLDATIVGDASRLDFLVSFPRVFRGTHLDHPKVSTLRGERFRVETLDGDVPMDLYASGERVGPLPAEVAIAPAALRVQVPAPDAGASR